MAGKLEQSCLSTLRLCLAALAVVTALSTAVRAEDPNPWDTGIRLRGAYPAANGETATGELPSAANGELSPAATAVGEEPAAAPEGSPPPFPPAEVTPANTTVIPRTDDAAAAPATTGQLNLVALLTADGQRIDQGLVWRIYEDKSDAKGEPKLLMTKREASPTVNLEPGDYLVNAAFGRADLTRSLTVTPGATASEKFVLNAGGLRVSVLVDGRPAPPNTVTYDIYSGERDQSDNRTKVLNRAKPNVVIRLNSGIYRIVSTYGDANAKVEADVNVEAGKLTEATISHSAARVTFKLVTRLGGEALPDTQWTVQTLEGQVVKHSVGALPTHILAPGTYTIIAKSGAHTFKRDFTLETGEIAQVEVLMR